jgi:hypothetical protein
MAPSVAFLEWLPSSGPLANIISAEPPGKFRVLGVDTFVNPPYGEPYVLADCDDKEEAIKMASAHGRPLESVYVYDGAGNYLFGSGKP